MPVAMIFVKPVLSVAERLGVPASVLLREAKVDAALASRDVCASVAAHQLVAIDAACARLTGLRSPCAVVGSLSEESSLHLLGHVLLASRTLSEACESLTRLSPFVLGDPVVALRPRAADRCQLELQWKQRTEASVMVAEIFLRVLARMTLRFEPLGAALEPTVIEFTHGGVVLEQAERMPGRTFATRYGASVDAVVFDRALLSTTLSCHDPEVRASLIDACMSAYLVGADGRSWTERVRQVLEREAEIASAEAGRVALRLGTSARALRRALAREGTTFTELLGDARMQRAVSYLSRPDETLKSIAERLGYSEQSAFHRAFKRWTGETPRTFRQTGAAAPLEQAADAQ